MPRIKIEDLPIGCPAAHSEGNCPQCGGGWPGTKSPSKKIISAIKNGDLLPMNLGCGTLEAQAEFLQDYFIRMFLIEKGVI